MTPNEMQNKLNEAVMNIQSLQAELDKLKQADTYFPESGEVVWVSDDLENWHKRIFIKFLGFNSSPYKCVWENKSNTTKNYLLGKNYITSDWAYCRRMDGEIIPFGRDKYKDPDYSHLLPDGYEFCKEDEAEKWLNVDESVSSILPIGYLFNNFQGITSSEIVGFRPIRQKVQYHVAVHEAVTTEPNPYAVDWTNAPDWADSHAFDVDGIGWWYGMSKGFATWWERRELSKFRLRSGLDWTKSKTTRP